VARKGMLLHMLEAQPADSFLHAALAQECVWLGEREEGLTRLRGVITRFPDYHAAHFQLAQLLSESGQIQEAKQIVQSGIQVAKTAGDEHAVSEMTGFLEMLGED